MQSVKIPWAAWYSDEKFELTFPDHWNLTVAEMKGGPDIGDEGIRQALANPIGTPPLCEFAQGRRSAAILVDDLSRPTPAFRLLPYVVEELVASLGRKLFQNWNEPTARAAMSPSSLVEPYNIVVRLDDA